ncbi:hypothetical protein Mmc1_0792 [Magnetococcus marinus MC-1]|uniref:Uncharacterized protein n=1 Tax=Magnetococcus marinus (strain ATCC BAA-1437 / JCM 17883 / MC-1) TaxID=156889 RepID=A0L5S0_MAGMM|nr:hypothetical protein Mmc1_0792 [Magnetococcus marinus MC-1]
MIIGSDFIEHPAVGNVGHEHPRNPLVEYLDTKHPTMGRMAGALYRSNLPIEANQPILPEFKGRSKKNGRYGASKTAFYNQTCITAPTCRN